MREDVRAKVRIEDRFRKIKEKVSCKKMQASRNLIMKVKRGRLVVSF